MSVCPQCGSPTKDNDKFCNGCGHSLGQAAPPPAAAAPPAWGAPPPQPVQNDAWGAPPAAQPVLQQGYVAPGAFGGPPAAPASPYGPPPGAAAATGLQGGYGGTPSPAQPSARCQQGHEIQTGASYCAAGHPIALDAMQFASDAYGAPPAPYQPPPPAQNPYGAPQQQQQPNFGAFGAPPPAYAPQPAQGLGGQPGYAAEPPP
ncbi:MAG: zinc ribbon domain-containing protein, partial [Polyangiaceae bacterium]